MYLYTLSTVRSERSHSFRYGNMYSASRNRVVYDTLNISYDARDTGDVQVYLDARVVLVALRMGCELVTSLWQRAEADP
jgi:hypothetical protein